MKISSRLSRSLVATVHGCHQRSFFWLEDSENPGDLAACSRGTCCCGHEYAWPKYAEPVTLCRVAILGKGTEAQPRSVPATNILANEFAAFDPENQEVTTEVDATFSIVYKDRVQDATSPYATFFRRWRSVHRASMRLIPGPTICRSCKNEQASKRPSTL